MLKETPKWEKGCLHICLKCAKTIELKNTKLDIELHEHLRSNFKKDLKELDLSSKIRVMSSSCLGTCREGKQAMCFSDSKAQEIIIIAPETEYSETLAYLIQKAKSN